MKKINTRSALAAAIGAARAAGKVMHANWHLPKRVNSAEAHDIKLELDVRCQKLIQQRLHREFPEIPLLGEEGISGDMNAEYRWVVDPIDGTVNYFFGMPHAAVSIALEHREKSLVGVIYDPFTDELWTAVRGGKALLNGKQIRVSERAQLNEAVIAMGFSKDKENMDVCLPHLTRLARKVKKIRILGSAALELAYVASGRLDAYIERRINLWDVAAGSLLVECAGGEFYSKPVTGKYRYTMCADNGKLRKKLQITSLLR
jgi:myo-inositol-1(or 4)-monophosphatase